MPEVSGNEVPFADELNRRWAEEIKELIDWRRHALRESGSRHWLMLIRQTTSFSKTDAADSPSDVRFPSMWRRHFERLPPLSSAAIHQPLGTAWWNSIDAESWNVAPVAKGADPLWVYGGAAAEWAGWIEKVRSNILVAHARRMLDELQDGRMQAVGCPQHGGRIGEPIVLPYRQFEPRRWSVLQDGSISFRDGNGAIWMCEDFRVSIQGRLESTEVVSEPLRSGVAGRPTSAHLIRQEFLRRVASNEKCTTKTNEAKHISAWLEEHHPEMPPAKPKSIMNSMVDLFRPHFKVPQRSGRVKPREVD